MPRAWILGSALVFFPPVTLHAIDYNSRDVQNALQRHDVRRLETFATRGEKLVRLEAIESLVRLKDAQVVPFLVRQLDDTDPDLVQAALWGLPSFGAQAASASVITHVEEVQHHPSVDVRKTAAIVLEDLHDPDRLKQMHIALVTKESEQHKEALEFYVQRKDLSILMEARDMLLDSDPFLKQTGIFLIHGLDDRDRLDTVAQLLKDPAPAVRASAALVIGEWKETDAYPLLAPLLKDADPLARTSAVIALGKHQTPHISAVLAELVKDPVPSVRSAAAKALGEVSSPASTQGLLTLLHGKE